MTQTRSHVKPRKQEARSLLRQFVLLLMFMGFIVGGLIITYDVLAPAPAVQP